MAIVARPASDRQTVHLSEWFLRDTNRVLLSNETCNFLVSANARTSQTDRQERVQ